MTYPGVYSPVTMDKPTDGQRRLRKALTRREAAEAEVTAAVHQMRRETHSLAAIGHELGMTRAAVLKMLHRTGYDVS